MKIYVAHSKLFDYKKEFYEPLRSSELNKLHDITLPHETDQFVNSKPIIKASDLVIAEVSHPAIGEGVELGWADDAGVKIICVYKEGSKVSQSLSVLSDTFLSYTSSVDLLEKLEEIIAKNQKQIVPQIIKDVGFDFRWSEEKVWQLDLPVEEMDIKELRWHFEIPFWNSPDGYYDLKPNDVINHPKQYPEEYQRIMKADLSYPLDIMYWKNRWLLLDGLHRLIKAYIKGDNTVSVRKVSDKHIPLIEK